MMLAATQDIDFLPSRYWRERDQRRRAVFRRGMLAVVLALMTVGAVGQRQMRGRLEQTRDSLHAHAQRMTAQLETPDRLRERIAALDDKANLLTWLHLRVAPTRLLATISRALPQYVSLHELDLRSEARGSSGLTPPAGDATGKPALPESPLRKDLETLQADSARRVWCVNLSGQAPDDRAIAQFLTRLKQSGLFAEVTLLYTDRQTWAEGDIRRFAARLELRPAGALDGVQTSVAQGSTAPDERGLAQRPDRRTMP